MIWRALIFAVCLALPASYLAAADYPPAFTSQGHHYVLYKTPFAAPLSELRDAEGRPFSLDRYRGRVVLLNFWATWCAPCVHEMPDLNRLQHALGAKGLAVVPVSLNRSPVTAGDFLRMLRLDALPLILDSEDATYRAFGPGGLPATYIITRTGQVHGYFRGPASWNGPEGRRLLQWYLDRKE